MATRIAHSSHIPKATLASPVRLVEYLPLDEPYGVLQHDHPEYDGEELGKQGPLEGPEYAEQGPPGAHASISPASAVSIWWNLEPGAAARRSRSPCSTMRPCSRTITSSQRSRVESRWAITITVRPFYEPVYGALYEPLGTGIDPRRGLVEDNDTRVSQEDPSERQQLGLARGHARALGAQHRVEAMGQVLVPGPQAEVLHHLDHPLVGDGVVEQRQVVPHGAFEEPHVLGDDADLTPQL